MNECEDLEINFNNSEGLTDENSRISSIYSQEEGRMSNLRSENLRIDTLMLTKGLYHRAGNEKYWPAARQMTLKQEMMIMQSHSGRWR